MLTILPFKCSWSLMPILVNLSCSSTVKPSSLNVPRSTRMKSFSRAIKKRFKSFTSEEVVKFTQEIVKIMDHSNANAINLVHIL